MTPEPLETRLTPALFGTAWPVSALTLSFAPDGTDVNGSPSRLPDAWRAEILRAAQTWVAAAGISVGLVADGGLPIGAPGLPQGDARFGDIRVAAVPIAPPALALGLPFDFTAGTRSGDVWLSADAGLSTDGTGYDLFTVALHEVGHALGLPESADPASAMFPEIGPPRAGLSAGDVAAVQARYGPRLPDRLEGDAGNDTPATATEARFNSGGSAVVVRKSADLTNDTDVDHFEFRAENLRGGGVAVSVAVSGVSLLSPRLDVLDAAGTVIGSAVGPAGGSGDVSLSLSGLTEGATYFARVSAGTPGLFGVGGYRLTLRPDSAEPPDPEEPENPDGGTNDTAATATEAERARPAVGTPFDYALSGSIETAADADFYRLRAPDPAGGAAGAFTALVWSAEGSPVLELFDDAGNPLGGLVVAREGGGFTIQLPAWEANRDYVVGVRGGVGNYTLAADFGGPAVALPVVASGTGGGTFALPLAEPQTRHFVLTAGPGDPTAVVRLTVLDPAGSPVGVLETAAGGAASINLLLGAGDYTLSVTGVGAFEIRSAEVSGPIGPRPVLIGVVPPVAPPVTPAPPRPPVSPAPPVPPGSFDPPRPGLPTSLTPPRGVAVAARSVVRTFAGDGSPRLTLDPFPGSPGGVRVASADLTGDGVPDVVAGTGPGRSTRVRVLDGVSGTEVRAFDPFEPGFTGGVFVAAADLSGDGVPDLVVTPDEGGGPRVRVIDGATGAVLADFFAIDDPAFRGGARAAAGDLNGDGRADLAVGAGFGGGPRVAVFDGLSLASVPRKLLGDFFLFEPALRNGVYLALGDLDGDGAADLIAGAGPGGGPRVFALSGRALVAGGLEQRANFLAGDPASRAGVRVSAHDLDGDARADLATGPGDGSGATLYLGGSIPTDGTPPAFRTLEGVAGGVFVG